MEFWSLTFECEKSFFLWRTDWQFWHDFVIKFALLENLKLCSKFSFQKSYELWYKHNLIFLVSCLWRQSFYSQLKLCCVNCRHDWESVASVKTEIQLFPRGSKEGGEKRLLTKSCLTPFVLSTPTLLGMEVENRNAQSLFQNTKG